MNWNDFKDVFAHELSHPMGYEEQFVDLVLAHIPHIKPTDVTPQYPFQDSKGKNRYIDFMVIHQGNFIPIELDGFSKLHDYGSSYDHFQDMLYRQNEVIRLYGRIFRFTNKDMFENTQYVIDTISSQIKPVKSAVDMARDLAIQKAHDEYFKELLEELEYKEEQTETIKPKKKETQTPWYAWVMLILFIATFIGSAILNNL